MTKEFSRLRSVQVLVEERQVAMHVTANSWRTHMFTGLETIPEKLKPSFADSDNDGDGQHDLDLLELVRKSYRTGRVENRFESPYRLGDSSKCPTVLRSIVITIQYRRPQSTTAPSLSLAK